MRDEAWRIAVDIAKLREHLKKSHKLKKICGALAVVKAWRTVARKAAPPAFYWLALSLIAFLGMREVVKIEATRTRLLLVVVVVGVAFCTACFLERLLRHYLLIDKEPKIEPRDVSGSLPQWLNRNRGRGERRAALRTGPQIQEGLWCWLPS